MNLIFGEIKQFVIKCIDSLEYIGEDTGSSGFEPPTQIYIDKLEYDKNYLIVELKDKNIYKIFYAGKLISWGIDYDGLITYVFSNGEYCNDYYKNYNFLNRDDNNFEKQINFDYNTNKNNNNNDEYDSDKTEDYHYSNFLFYELEDGFDENKLIDILQFCIDNSENKKECLCLNNKKELLQIYNIFNKKNKNFTNKINNELLKKNHEIYFKL